MAVIAIFIFIGIIIVKLKYCNAFIYNLNSSCEFPAEVVCTAVILGIDINHLWPHFTAPNLQDHWKFVSDSFGRFFRRSLKIWSNYLVADWMLTLDEFSSAAIYSTYWYFDTRTNRKVYEKKVITFRLFNK